MKTNDLTLQSLRKPIHKAIQGRVAAYYCKRYSALFNTIWGNCNLSYSQKKNYVSSVFTSYVWHDFHSRIADTKIFPCASYGFFKKNVHTCYKPAICPNCSARQFTKAFNDVVNSGASHVLISRVISDSLFEVSINEMMCNIKHMIKKSNADRFFILPKLFPCENAKQIRFGVVVMAYHTQDHINFDVIDPSRYYASTSNVFTLTECGVATAIKNYATYPVKLLTIDPAVVKHAYSVSSIVKASSTRNKKKHDLKDKRQYNTGRFAPGVANLEIQTTDSGGCLSEPGVCSGLVSEQQLLTEAGR